MPANRLPWIKFWPEAIEHEKFAQLSDAESWSWVVVWAKASVQPTRWRFASIAHVVHVTGRPKRHVNKLITVRLLDETADGITIHDARYWQDAANLTASHRETWRNHDGMVAEEPAKTGLEGEGEGEGDLNSMPSLPAAPAFAREANGADLDAAALLAEHERLLAKEQQGKPAGKNTSSNGTTDA